MENAAWQTVRIRFNLCNLVLSPFCADAVTVCNTKAHRCYSIRFDDVFLFSCDVVIAILTKWNYYASLVYGSFQNSPL